MMELSALKVGAWYTAPDRVPGPVVLLSTMPDADGDLIMQDPDTGNLAYAKPHELRADLAPQLETMRQRRNWLTARIAAKLSVGWDVEWDTRERDALTWALGQLGAE